MKELRFSQVTDIYYSLTKQTRPNQLDLLDQWFHGFIVRERTEGEFAEAEYVDREYLIYASRRNGRLYSGESSRISQILGRLIGSAKGNREKERKTAELIQKHIAQRLINEPDAIDSLLKTVDEKLAVLTDDQMDDLLNILINYTLELCHERYQADEYDRLNEPFAMDDEVFDGLIYNAGYQLNNCDYDSIVNGYLWLLLGGLLRNEAGRVVRMYHSGFSAVNRQLSETGGILDKLHYLYYPEDYYSTYSGDDLDNRFPGVSWICDRCGAILNQQPGFDDHLEIWQCRHCNELNLIDYDQLNNNTEDYLNGNIFSEREKADFDRAIEERKKQIQKEK